MGSTSPPDDLTIPPAQPEDANGHHAVVRVPVPAVAPSREVVAPSQEVERPFANQPCIHRQRAKKLRRALERAPWVLWTLVPLFLIGLLVRWTLWPTPPPPPAEISTEELFKANSTEHAAEGCYAVYLEFSQDASAPARQSRDALLRAKCQPPDETEFGWGGQGSQEVYDISVVKVAPRPKQPNVYDVTVSAFVNGPEQVCHVMAVLNSPEGYGIAEGPSAVSCPKALPVNQPKFSVDERLSEELKPTMAAFFRAFAGSEVDETNTKEEQDQAALKKLELARLMADNRPITGLPPSYRLGSENSNGVSEADKGIVAVKVAKAKDDAVAGQTGDRREAKVTVRWVRPAAANATMHETYSLTLVKRDDHWFVERLHEVQAQGDRKDR